MNVGDVQNREGFLIRYKLGNGINPFIKATQITGDIAKFLRERLNLVEAILHQSNHPLGLLEGSSIRWRFEGGWVERAHRQKEHKGYGTAANASG